MSEIIPKSGIQTSAFLVTVTNEALDIKAISEERGLIDHIKISTDNTITELMPIMHFQWK